jgi:hypothetical protein
MNLLANLARDISDKCSSLVISSSRVLTAGERTLAQSIFW